MPTLSPVRRALPSPDGSPDYPRLVTLRLVPPAPPPAAPPPVAAARTSPGYLRRWRSAARRRPRPA